MKKFLIYQLFIILFVALVIGIATYQPPVQATLPNTLDSSTPTGSELLSLGASRIRALKQWILDAFNMSSGISLVNPILKVTGGYGTLANGSPCWEGTTVDGTNKTCFAVVDPTAPRTITFADASFTVSPPLAPAYATADQSISSQTSLQSSTYLAQTLVTGGTYQFRADVKFNIPNQTMGLKLTIGGTATATSTIFSVDLYDSSTVRTSVIQALGTPLTVTSLSANGLTHAVIEGTIQVNSGGTLVVQFAQFQSNGNSMTLKKGSILTMVKF